MFHQKKRFSIGDFLLGAPKIFSWIETSSPSAQAVSASAGALTWMILKWQWKPHRWSMHMISHLRTPLVSLFLFFPPSSAPFLGGEGGRCNNVFSWVPINPMCWHKMIDCNCRVDISLWFPPPHPPVIIIIIISLKKIDCTHLFVSYFYFFLLLKLNKIW